MIKTLRNGLDGKAVVLPWGLLLLGVLLLMAAMSAGASAQTLVINPAQASVSTLPASTGQGSTQAPAVTQATQAAIGQVTATGGLVTPESVLGPEPLHLGLHGLVALLLVALAALVVGRKTPVNRIEMPGFEVISATEPRTFLPLEERNQNLDFVNKIDTRGGLRISANLNKVSLSIRRFGYLMEDKNFRNALLVNRRRVRRTLLRDGDVLDLGDLTLLYRDNRQIKVVRHASVTPGDGKSQVKFDRTRGPVRRGMPMLVSEQSPNRTFYLTKNLVFIGRSERNDLVIKSKAVHYRHAKIERVGGQYKIQDLSLLGSTFVNNRRVEQRFLREGDEISIENHRFKFQFATKALREKPPRASDMDQESDQDTDNPDTLYDQGGDEGTEDASYAP